MEKNVIQVIIPVYNSEKTLKKCLDSLKSQTFEHWQAILVNDMSSDNSEKIIEEYTRDDERFIYIKHEKNSGASGSRNTALEQVDAEYIAFLDSDDYWEPDMLESLYSEAKKCDADIVQCRFIYDFPGGKQVLPSGAFKKNILLRGKALKKVYIKMMTGINMNHVCMKLIKADVAKGVMFDTTLPTAEDLEFCVRLFQNVKRYYFTTEVMYHYVRSENSLTGKGLSGREKLKANRRVSKVILTMLPAWGIDTPFYRLLALSRPYVIIISKVLRIVREKIIIKCRVK